MDNINDILRAKRIVRNNGYRIEKPARDYDYEREDRMNLIRAKRIVKDAGYNYTKNTPVVEPEIEPEELPVQKRRIERPEIRPRRQVVDDKLTRADSFDNERPIRRTINRMERPVTRRPSIRPTEEISAEPQTQAPSPAPVANPRKSKEELYQDIAAKYV